MGEMTLNGLDIKSSLKKKMTIEIVFCIWMEIFPRYL